MAVLKCCHARMVVGGQDGALLATHHAFERGAQGNLSLAHADIAAQQAVHRPGLLHIMFDLRRAGKLVRRFIIGKALLKISLPGIIWWEGMTVRPFAAGIQLNQLLGHLLGSGAHLLAGLGPLGPAQAAELDILRIPRRGVAGKQVQLGDGNIQHIFFIVLNAQVVFGNALNRHSLDARIPANAVVLVHHQIARRDLGQAVQGIFGLFTLFSSGSWSRQRHGLSAKYTWQTEIRTQRKGAPPEPAPARQRGLLQHRW